MTKALFSKRFKKQVSVTLQYLAFLLRRMIKKMTLPTRRHLFRIGWFYIWLFLHLCKLRPRFDNFLFIISEFHCRGEVVGWNESLNIRSCIHEGLFEFMDQVYRFGLSDFLKLFVQAFCLNFYWTQIWNLSADCYYFLWAISEILFYEVYNL